MRLSTLEEHLTDPTAALSRQRFPTVLVWLAAASLAAIFAIFALVLHASQLDVQAAARTASSSLAAEFSRDIQREVELLDMSLLDLRDGASNDEMMSLPQKIRSAVLFDRAASARGLGALLLLDPQGRVVEQAGAGASKPVDLSAEPFFRVHADRPDVGLFVSHPFVSLVDGETSVAVSRRIDRMGVFAGVAVGTIKVSYLQEILGKLDIGATGSMSLILEDGTLVIEQPFAQSVSQLTTPYRWVAERVGSATAGSFHAPHAADGAPREYFFQRVGSLPFMLLVSRNTYEIYAAWWQRTILTGLATSLLVGTVLLLVLVLHGELKRRQEVEAELALLASTDKLTGLANRRTFDHRFDQAWSGAKRNRTSLALLLMDIDHFKTLNDLIGHQEGDRVLASVGACLSSIARGRADLAARYGGEEFVLLLPDTSAKEALAVAEAVRTRLAELARPHPSSPSGWMTMSIGVAAATPLESQAPADLFRSADLALYQAKRTGRNRILAANALTMAA